MLLLDTSLASVLPADVLRSSRCPQERARRARTLGEARFRQVREGISDDHPEVAIARLPILYVVVQTQQH